MKILNKDSYWWKGQEKEWATQDHAGDWWIYRSQKVKKPNMIIKKTSKERSNYLTPQQYAILLLCAVLGVSLALNVVAIIS